MFKREEGSHQKSHRRNLGFTEKNEQKMMRPRLHFKRTAFAAAVWTDWQETMAEAGKPGKGPMGVCKMSVPAGSGMYSWRVGDTWQDRDSGRWGSKDRGCTRIEEWHQRKWTGGGSESWTVDCLKLWWWWGYRCTESCMTVPKSWIPAEVRWKARQQRWWGEEIRLLNTQGILVETGSKGSGR